MRMFIICLLLMMSTNAFAADVYMSVSGTKTSGKSTSGDWSNANCYSNIQAAMAAMSSGDTLVINDGTYTGVSNVIDQAHYPPSGPGSGTGDSRFTIVKARNIPTNEALKVVFDGGSGAGILASGSGTGAPTYIKFHGIQFNRANTYTGWDHLYFKQCAFMGITDGNSAAMGIGGAYNLVEDCVFYGKGRYKVLFYDYTRELNSNGAGDNVCRRCVARNDFALKDEDTSNPIATFASYYSTGSAFLNSIDVDSDSPTYWKTNPEELASSFYQPFENGALSHNLLIQGSMAINSALGGVYTEQASSGNQIKDFASVKTGGGFWCKDGCSVDGGTIVDLGLDNFTYKSADQISVFVARHYALGGYNANIVSSNLILSDVNPADYILLNSTASYINTYNLGKSLNGTISNQITTEPYSNGLLYPVRIETGSALATAGSGGGQIGAKILNKLGIDGTFKGETDWDTEQGTLWPWPMEDWVKAQMASMPATITGDAMPSSTRGFVSPTAKRIDGVNPVTLTSYIWESLGNQIPADIYGDEIPGLCGPSNGLALSSAPVTDLCAAGTASAVTGTGPWSWTCAGSGGGSTANCGATLLEGPVGNASALVACPAIAGFR